jgi:hypothetical protein
MVVSKVESRTFFGERFDRCLRYDPYPRAGALRAAMALATAHPERHFSNWVGTDKHSASNSDG